jgi:hypothetical protein
MALSPDAQCQTLATPKKYRAFSLHIKLDDAAPRKHRKCGASIRTVATLREG